MARIVGLPRPAPAPVILAVCGAQFNCSGRNRRKQRNRTAHSRLAVIQGFASGHDGARLLRPNNQRIYRECSRTRDKLMKPLPATVRTTRSLAAAICLMILCPATPTQAATFLGLSDLANGTFNSRANAVSSDGSVVVGFGTSASGQEAFRWTSAGGMIGLSDLTGGSFSSSANGVSANGSVVVGAGNSASGPEAFRWTSGGGLAGLSDLAGGSFNSIANAVSADGLVVVGAGNTASGSEAFRWTSGGGMVSIGSSYARGVSADGSVVVGNVTTTAPEAFRWTSSGGLVKLGDLPGSPLQSDATGVSANGSVVVGQGNSATGAEAFRWTSGGGMVGLGDLAGGLTICQANGVSADGSIIVGYGFTALGSEAFVWDAINGMRNLKDFLAPRVGGALTGWTLTSAQAISADGRTIVGYGTNASGNTEAWSANLGQIYWSNASGAWDSANSWINSSVPQSLDDVVIDPSTAVTVTGPAANQSVYSLSIGGASVSRVTLRLAGATTGDVLSSTAAVFASNAELALANGRIFTAPTLNNSGLVHGTGTVSANLTNAAGGQVRAAAGESLVVSGTGHTNNGMIEAIGGTVEFIGPVTNSASTGLIAGQSAFLRFNSGLTNSGSLLLSAGVNNVFGDIINSVTTGKIMVAGGAAATFYDDVVQNGLVQVIKVGSTNSTAVFAGTFTGGGSSGGGDIFFLGDLRPGNSPAIVNFDNNVGFGTGASLNVELGGTTAGTQYDKVVIGGSLALGGTLNVSLINSFNPQAGNSFDILDWTSLSGVFDAISLPALGVGLAWNTTQLYVSGALSVTLVGDYNHNGAVDGADYIVWRKGLGTTYTQNDFNVWRANFGHTAGGSGAAFATSQSAAVPEPASLWLGLVAAALLRLGRRRG